MAIVEELTRLHHLPWNFFAACALAFQIVYWTLRLLEATIFPALRDWRERTRVWYEELNEDEWAGNDYPPVRLKISIRLFILTWVGLGVSVLIHRLLDAYVGEWVTESGLGWLLTLFVGLAASTVVVKIAMAIAGDKQ